MLLGSTHSLAGRPDAAGEDTPSGLRGGLHFRITCAETLPGWHVRVVGSCQSLGMWDPQGGLLLFTSPRDFPVWWHSGRPCRLDGQVEYKYVICDDALTMFRWEAIPNRVLHASMLKCGASIVVAESFGIPAVSEPPRIRPPPALPVTPMGAASSPSTARASRYRGARSPERTCREAAAAWRSKVPSRSGDPAGPEAPGARKEEGTLRPPEVVGSSCGSMSSGGFEEAPESDLVRELSVAGVYRSAAEVAGLSQSFQKHYTLIGDKALGEGSFGTVWRCALATGVGPQCAAKVVRRDACGDNHGADRQFLLGEESEITIHMSLRHPHIVGFLEYFAEQLVLTLVLECCDGGDLFDAIMDCKEASGAGLPHHQAAVAVRHTLEAVAYLHRQSIVHRDVKCENILLARKGVPLEQNVFKLCDFGLSAHDDGEGLRDCVGSPDSVAPEIVVGPCHSYPADLWSVGVLIYTALSARQPFLGQSDEEVLHNVSLGRYSLAGKLWDAVPAPPKHVITSLVVVDPRLRPTAKEALGKAWFEATHAAKAVGERP